MQAVCSCAGSYPLVSGVPWLPYFPKLEKAGREAGIP